MATELARKKHTGRKTQRRQFHRFSASRADAHRLQPRNLQPRRLQLEALEARLTMSAVTATANSALVSWFNSHVQTLSIRNLGVTDIKDGVLSRSDVLGIFKAVEQAGKVTATEFSDLKNIVNDAALFTNVGYVEQLASDVVLGNVANAHYLGKALGNLAVGTSAANLTNLVGKWFLGTDHPLGKSDWGPTYAYRKVSGQLFVNGVSFTDVYQGGLGDCYFLSALAETALKNPAAITSMFIVNGDGTYTVRFMEGSKAEYVTVDSQLPTDSSGHLVFDGMGRSASNSSNELWVALAEKAYVEMNECGWIRPASWGGGQNVYTGISGGAMYMALSQITGQSTVAYTSTADTAFNTMAAAFNAGKSICFGSKEDPANTNLVVGDHAYAVVAVNTTTHTVTLFNPWGLNNGHDSGTITLSWAQVQANFDWYDRTA